MPEKRRIIVFAFRDQHGTRTRDRGQFIDARRFGGGRERLRSAAARQIGQSIEGCLGRAETFDQTMERDRTDILAADEPQPSKPVSIGKGHRRYPARFRPIRLSSPRKSRRIFS